MSTYKLGSLFAGIGGIDLGFERAGVSTIWANEIDQYCAKTYIANHKSTKLIVDDINNLHTKDLEDIDILTGGFPCQPFSIAGYRKGFEDDRGNLFFQIIRLLKEFKEDNRLPKVVFLENVKNLYSHNNGKTFKLVKEELSKLGYNVIEKILNTCEYGNIPQNRERLYIIAFLHKKDKDKFIWPNKIPLTNTLNNIIDWNSEVDQKYYYSPQMKCYPLLIENIKNKNSIYQFRRVYIRENKSGVCPTLTANMGMGGHNVHIIMDSKNRIRKITPRECLLLQGFPKDFIIPKDLCDSRVYKQAGNSVSVEVIYRIAKEIVRILNEEQYWLHKKMYTI